MFKLNNYKAASVTVTLSIAVGLIALMVGLLIGGGAAATALADPGDVVRYGQPIAKFIFNLAMAASAGTLIFAAFALSENSPLLRKALDLTAAASVLWALAAAANFLFTYLNVAGTAIKFDDAFGQSLWMFATQIEMGTSLALNGLAAVLISVLALSIRKLTPTAMLAAFGIAAIIPLALIGHAAGTANHAMAVNSIGLHILSVIIWVGGLFALFVLRGRNTDESEILTKRYSSLALFAFVLLAISGIASALVRINSPDEILSAYGQIILLKTVAFVMLGVVGGLYRRRIARKSFWLLAGFELAIMGVAIGLATALAKTAPPTTGDGIVEVTPAQLLTGEQLPPELTALGYLTAWKIDLLWLVIGVAAIVAYLVGVRRLAKRGDKWPWLRTASWITGMLTLIYVTSGALNAYQEYLFSVHMIGHMILAMGIPVLLVPGAPVTLLMRAVEKRHDDSRGVREWVLWAVHTKYARFISNPLIAAALFASSLVTFYYTPLFAWATHEHIGHEWMVVHFLITGYLFAQALIGIDPGPYRMPFAARLLLLIATMAFHAFFGLSLMDGSGLLLPDWYGAMGRTWGDDPLTDQHTGGAIAWGVGELPTAALTIIVAIQWFKSDTREAKRMDRQSDRTGGQDIEEYNRMLARLAKQDERGR